MADLLTCIGGTPKRAVEDDETLRFTDCSYDELGYGEGDVVMFCDRDEVETVIESDIPSTANRRISSRKFFLKNFSRVSWKGMNSGGHKCPWSFRQPSMVRTYQSV